MTQDVVSEQTIEGNVYWLVREEGGAENCLKCCFANKHKLCDQATDCDKYEGSYFVEGEEVQESKFGQRIYGTIGGGHSLTNIGGATGGGAYLETNRVLPKALEKKVEEMQEKEVSALDKQVAGGHYKDLKIQPVEYIVANNLSFLEGNIVKYTTRHRMKGGAEDIKKVIHYCELILELQYGQGKEKE